MTQFLPANLLALFTARPAIPFKPPPDGLKKKKNAHPYFGVSEFMNGFEVEKGKINCVKIDTFLNKNDSLSVAAMHYLF